MKKNGFSLIELLIVIFVIGVLSSVIFINYQEVRGQLALNRAAHQLLQNLRRAQEMAMSAVKINPGSCVSRAPLHFASLGPIAYDEPFWVDCEGEVIGNEHVKFTAYTEEPAGHLSYSWSGYAQGCSDNHICQKDIVAIQDGYIGGVEVTNDNGEVAYGTCFASSAPIGGGGEVVPGAVPADFPEGIDYYGIYINTNPATGSSTSYKMYADVNGSVGYNAGDCGIENINIAEPGVVIQSINNLTLGTLDVSINFAPPNPDINIIGLDPNEEAVEIVLALANNPTKQKIVSVNKAGLLEIK